MIYISRVEGGVVDSGQYCNKRGKGVGLTLAQQRRGFGIYIKMTQGKLIGGKKETATNGVALTLAKHQRGFCNGWKLGVLLSHHIFCIYLVEWDPSSYLANMVGHVRLTGFK